MEQRASPGLRLCPVPGKFGLGLAVVVGLRAHGSRDDDDDETGAKLIPNMVLEPGGGLSFPPPPGAAAASSSSTTSVSAGPAVSPLRLFQRAEPVFPFHLPPGWHHPVLGQVQSQVQQSMQAAAAVRFLSHHHPHHGHPALGSHPLAVPAIAGHHPAAHHLHQPHDPNDDDDDKKGEFDFGYQQLIFID